MATVQEAASDAHSALMAYECLAPFYDQFTADYEYERWLACIEGLALAHGMQGRRLLDVGCGTGKSFAPLLARGYELTACDISPAMVALAQERLPSHHGGRVLVADMRALPELGEFDLITCMDDAVNDLLDRRQLVAAFRSAARLLAPSGIYAFDANSLHAYRTGFASHFLPRGRTHVLRVARPRAARLRPRRGQQRDDRDFRTRTRRRLDTTLEYARTASLQHRRSQIRFG